MGESKKRWILNAFAMQAPDHLNPGLLNYPKDQGHKYKDIHHWIALAKELEEAKLHSIFFADVLGGCDVYRGPANLGPTIPAAAQYPINDPLYAIPEMAASTNSIGFGVTALITYDPPYAPARRFSTVDHLSNGRVACNIVTSYLDSAARNFSLKMQIEHDERHRTAHEYLHVTYNLWEGYWRDDAVLSPPSEGGDPRGNNDGAYADPKAVRQIDHQGEYFTVPGPHLYVAPAHAFSISSGHINSGPQVRCHTCGSHLPERAHTRIKAPLCR